MTTILADYAPEREAFAALLQPDCEKRILTFHGESGTGKTSLINFCMENIPQSVEHLHLNFKGSAISVAEVFSRSGFKLSWDCFPRFIDQVAELSGVAHVNVDSNWLAGITNSPYAVLSKLGA